LRRGHEVFSVKNTANPTPIDIKNILLFMQDRGICRQWDIFRLLYPLDFYNVAHPTLCPELPQKSAKSTKKNRKEGFVCPSLRSL